MELVCHLNTCHLLLVFCSVFLSVTAICEVQEAVQCALMQDHVASLQALLERHCNANTGTAGSSGTATPAYSPGECKTGGNTTVSVRNLAEWEPLLQVEIGAIDFSQTQQRVQNLTIPSSFVPNNATEVLVFIWIMVSSLIDTCKYVQSL
jgi:hypothetical protein